MKLTQQQLIDLAIKAGVPHVEIVADEKESDFNEDTALQSIHAAILPLIKPGIENELKGAMETSAKAKTRGELLSLLARQTGITRAELEKLGTPEAVEFAFKSVSDKLGGDATKWQQEIQTLMDTHNQSITKIKTEEGAKLTAATQRYIDRDINAYLQDNVVAKSPLLPTADKGYWAEQLRSHLQSKYHLSYDDSKRAVSTFKKDNPEIPALNEAGTGTINLQDEFKAIASRAGVWTTDTRNVKPGAKTDQNNNANNNTQTNVAGKSMHTGQRGRVSQAEMDAALALID